MFEFSLLADGPTLLGDNTRRIATLFLFLTVVAGVYAFAQLLLRRPSSAGHNTVEQSRRERLRRNSPLYRLLEPGIDDLIGLFSATQKKELPNEFGSPSTPWFKGEALAAGLLTGGCIGWGLALISLLKFPIPVAFILFAITLGLTTLACYSQIEAAGMLRKKSLVRRLPYIVDLMALVQEAGGSFQDALRAAAKENRDHPIGEELGEVANRIDRGVAQSEALQHFSEKYEDDNIRYFVSSINQGVYLGVPLVQILRNQSDEMLRRRSQWIEKASAEAKVKISGPGFIIALACMMIMVAPFILQVVGTF